MFGMRSSSGGGYPSRQPPTTEERRLALTKQLEEVDAILKDCNDDIPIAESAHSAVSASRKTEERLVDSNSKMEEDSEKPVEDSVKSKRPATKVVIGNAKMTQDNAQLPMQLTTMVNRAYDYQRVDIHDILERLAMGDPGSHRANRVLHVAFLGDAPVGCMSSTFKVPWAEEGCGHWGLLVVDVEHQGKGIASALVKAAEERLAGCCVEIQMEYEYTPGDAMCERLMAWYEGRCGFRCATARNRGGPQFRKCRKPVPEEAQRKGRRQRLLDIRADFSAELAALQ